MVSGGMDEEKDGHWCGADPGVVDGVAELVRIPDRLDLQTCRDLLGGWLLRRSGRLRVRARPVWAGRHGNDVTMFDPSRVREGHGRDVPDEEEHGAGSEALRAPRAKKQSAHVFRPGSEL